MSLMVSELVQRAAPAHAKLYRLQITFSDGNSRIYPEGVEAYVIGQAPTSTPPGTYSVCYYDQAGHLIELSENVVVELGLESRGRGTAQIGMSLTGASGSARSAIGTAGATGAASTERRASEPAPQKAGLAVKAPVAPLAPEADLEYVRLQHAVEMEERQQEFIKNSTYVTEIGELFALNRVMRREMMEMQRVIVQQSQQAHKDLDLMKTTLRDLFKLQQEALEKASAMLPAPPPPPPPDYVGLGNTALSVIKELGVALINRREPGALRAGGKSSQPALPPSAENVAAPAAPPSGDILERIVSKLKGTNEIDLAVAMSTPESWKAFLGDLLPQKEPAQGSPPGPAKEPAAPPAKETAPPPAKEPEQGSAAAPIKASEPAKPQLALTEGGSHADSV